MFTECKEVSEIRNRIKDGERQQHVANYFGIDPSLTRRIGNGTAYKYFS
jgi:hypothetical protein